MILVGDNRATLPTIERGSVQCVATSPPYFGLRLYGDAGEEIGKEVTLALYLESLRDVMRLCWDALRDDGTAWVNLGDSYGPDGKALLVPLEAARWLQADGWTLRAMLPWPKLNGMPESVQSRPSISHEYVLFLTKKPSGYFYDADAVRVANCARVMDEFASAVRRGTAGRARGHLGSAPDRNDSGEKMGAHSSATNPAGRSLRSSDFWRAGARSAAEQLQQAADGQAIGLLTNDDAPAALIVNPKGSGIEHFAMWPTRLVAPMIMAGTPEAGSCSVCGAPWERMVERTPMIVREGPSRAATRAAANGASGSRTACTGTMLQAPSSRTLGFRPSCAHASAPARPAIVLDPFAGACTTLGVAEALGRQAIGCELYQANADLMPRRIDVVRTEMIEILKEQGSARAGDVEQAQKADRHKGAVRQDDGPLFGGKL